MRLLNRLTPNDPYMGRTAPLTSKRSILYIYSTNKSTEYFKNALYSPSFSLQNAVCFIMLTCFVPVLSTFYIQGVLKLKENNSGAKGLKMVPKSCPAISVNITTIRCVISQKNTDLWCYMLVGCWTLEGESCITCRIADWMAPPLDLNRTV